MKRIQKLLVMRSESDCNLGLERRVADGSTVSAASAQLDGRAASMHRTSVAEQLTEQARQRILIVLSPATRTIHR